MKEVQRRNSDPLQPVQGDAASKQTQRGSLNGRTVDHPNTEVQYIADASDTESEDSGRGSMEDIRSRDIASNAQNSPTRIDKRDSGEPFTKIFMKSVYGQDITWVELLNTVPEETLAVFDASSRPSVEAKDKKNAWSPEALESLGIAGNVQHQGVILGEGGFGTVKLGRFIAPDTGKTVFCAVKKIKGEADETEEALEKRCLREAKLQNQAGSQISPRVYGYSFTRDQKGDPIGMIFTALAEGVKGDHFLNKIKADLAMSTDEEKEDIIASQLKSIVNILKAAELLEDAEVVHRDIKSNNVFFNNRGVQFIDFGQSCSIDDPCRGSGEPVECYLAPELASNQLIDGQLADRFSIGVLFLELASSDPYTVNEFTDPEDGILSWDPIDTKNLQALQEKIDRKLEGLSLSDDGLEADIRCLLSADPSKRVLPDYSYEE